MWILMASPLSPIASHARSVKPSWPVLKPPQLGMSMMIIHLRGNDSGSQPLLHSSGLPSLSLAFLWACPTLFNPLAGPRLCYCPVKHFLQRCRLMCQWMHAPGISAEECPIAFMKDSFMIVVPLLSCSGLEPHSRLLAHASLEQWG